MLHDLRQGPDGVITGYQRQQIPAVYLDFCALRIIAESPELSARFIAAIRHANASLMISWMTISEFSLLTDMRHAKAADAMFHQLFLHLFFFECEPYTVMANENAMSDGKHEGPAHGDTGLLIGMLQHAFAGQEPFEMASIISGNAAAHRPKHDEVGMRGRKAFAAVQQRLKDDPNARKIAAKMLQELPQRGTATMALLVALMKPLYDDRLPKHNDIIDLLHAIVPCASAEFVVLDGRWASAVEQATKRIRKAGHMAPVAKVFSPRRNGIADFLAALEAFPAATA